MAVLVPNLKYYLRLRAGRVSRNGDPLFPARPAFTEAEDLYRILDTAYPKFFKMDLLCRWAWLAAECLLQAPAGALYRNVSPERVAVALFTRTGCLEADRRYAETLTTVPSPALFVYTLSNIMLGEICIRHGFKGEQLCMSADAFDGAELTYAAQYLMQREDTDACLCGWVDLADGQPDICLFWVERPVSGAAPQPFLPAAAEACYRS